MLHVILLLLGNVYKYYFLLSTNYLINIVFFNLYTYFNQILSTHIINKSSYPATCFSK